METRILVPLDGSPLAEQALTCAATVGRWLSAELVLMRAISVPQAGDKDVENAAAEGGELLRRLDTEAGEYLQGVAEQMRLGGLRVRTVVQRGPAAEAIVDYAEQTGIRHIIMTTGGDNSIRRQAHESVAERVLQAAGVPVLIIRAREQEA
jgi:nucleotide-binding universal stress UspA family protein